MMPEPRFPNALRGALKEERRARQVHVPPDLMARWIQSRGSLFPVVSGLPEDAELTNVAYDFYAHAIVLTFEHPDFPVVPPERVIPTLAVRTTLAPRPDGEEVYA